MRRVSSADDMVKQSSSETPYERLANAIILLAVRDYRDALALLNKNPNSKDAKSEKASIERFFRSEWYGILTSLDGEMLIRRLNEEAKE